MALFAWASVAAAGISVGACQGAPVPLRVGANLWPGYEPLYLAQSLGYVEAGVARIIRFSSATEVVRAYRNGLVDAAALTADEAILATSGAASHRIVLVFDVSNGADALVAKPELRTLSDLRGARVGVEATALGAFMLARALEHAGMTPQDVHVVPTALADHEQAFRDGSVDAVVTFEPRKSRLLKQGARSLFDSSQIPGEVVDVLVTRQTLSPPQERALAQVVAAWFRTLDFMRDHRDDANARMARLEGITPSEFEASLVGIELGQRAFNSELLAGSSPRMLETLDLMARLLPDQYHRSGSAGRLRPDPAYLPKEAR
ncbi:MAG: ABC transporter substrate-binding protein [Vicinamibacterales bacterium]